MKRRTLLRGLGATVPLAALSACAEPANTTPVENAMTARSLDSHWSCSPQPGTGILHPFPTQELAHIDPFVFLDTGAPKQLGDKTIYVGPHAHRGVQPVSLLFRGRIEHRDSLGNHRTVTSGGMQWLVSGRGALHEEVLGGDEEGVFHMAQLWINVPASHKLAAPEHHAVEAAAIPEIESLGAKSRVRLYAGELAGQVGPAPMPTPVVVAHVILQAGGEVTLPLKRSDGAAFTVVAGQVTSAAQTMAPGDTALFAHDGDAVVVTSEEGGELLLMSGTPIGEPIAMGGGFVMNSREEIAKAFADYQRGAMGQLAASGG